MDKINVTLYRWAGQWGPFKVNIPCGECTLTHDIIEDTLANELKNIPVQLHTYDWLSHWWQPLQKGGWHAPIVMVEGKVISQGAALNRSLLVQAIVQAHAEKTPIKGTHLFGKSNCEFCQKAKQLFASNHVEYQYHDVIKEPNALYEMLSRVKPIIGPKTPVTMPQIWINDNYIGGASALSDYFNQGATRE